MKKFYFIGLLGAVIFDCIPRFFNFLLNTLGFYRAYNNTRVRCISWKSLNPNHPEVKYFCHFLCVPSFQSNFNDIFFAYFSVKMEINAILCLLVKTDARKIRAYDVK